MHRASQPVRSTSDGSSHPLSHLRFIARPSSSYVSTSLFVSTLWEPAAVSRERTLRALLLLQSVKLAKVTPASHLLSLPLPPPSTSLFFSRSVDQGVKDEVVREEVRGLLPFQARHRSSDLVSITTSSFPSLVRVSPSLCPSFSIPPFFFSSLSLSPLSPAFLFLPISGLPHAVRVDVAHLPCPLHFVFFWFFSSGSLSSEL